MAIHIDSEDPRSVDAQRMIDALWVEIQQRYGFEAPNPLDVDDFRSPGGFWVARDADDGSVFGSVGLIDRGTFAEVDAMYVAPAARGAGVGRALLTALEAHAIQHGMKLLKLRAGAPQPEALAFYRQMSFVDAAAFGHWVDDPTAMCFEKRLD